MKSYKRVIGIDICTVRLDIADSNLKIEKAIEYTVESIKAKIIKLIKEPSETLVVCEATVVWSICLLMRFTMRKSMLWSRTLHVFATLPKGMATLKSRMQLMLKCFSSTASK